MLWAVIPKEKCSVLQGTVVDPAVHPALCCTEIQIRNSSDSL